jgi:putative salt-induced outer membrane protein YdiY
MGMRTRTPVTLLLAAGLLAQAAAATAQTAPPPGWAGSTSAGLALTSGNSDTSTVNAAYELKRDDGGTFVFKSGGLLVWGKSGGELTSDRLSLDGRAERKLGGLTALFMQTQYLRDSFKSVDYLIAPTVGVSRTLVTDDRTALDVDVSVGGVWEKNEGADTDLDAALSAGQKFSHKLTATTTLTQKMAALWTMDDFGDALYALGVGVAVNVTAGTQLKVEFLDTYKAQPLPGVVKNDIAILVSFVYKFE